VKTEFVKVNPAREMRSLLTFDHKVFPKGDWFSENDWLAYESYWMLVDKRKVGCCAFERHKRTLHITSTGILPEVQGQGLGTLFKAWQIAFARRHGFARMVTTSRKSNRSMIDLNRRFGFRVVRTVNRFYSDPVESAVVMAIEFGS
jgi:ribosomal protein S18 acetylase RimI-like enzyme